MTCFTFGNRKILSLAILLIVLFSANAQQKRPNIIWITCEDISPFVGAYGDQLVKTPNIDKLAKEGIRYNYVFTAAGVCAPSRSSFITGMYPTSIGTMHMRTIGDPKFQPVPPYSAVIPADIKCFPEYLRKTGYYCTNNEKQDYQFIPPVTVWDENGATASFRNRRYKLIILLLVICTVISCLPQVFRKTFYISWNNCRVRGTG